MYDDIRYIELMLHPRSMFIARMLVLIFVRITSFNWQFNCGHVCMRSACSLVRFGNWIKLWIIIIFVYLRHILWTSKTLQLYEQSVRYWSKNLLFAFCKKKKENNNCMKLKVLQQIHIYVMSNSGIHVWWPVHMGINVLIIEWAIILAQSQIPTFYMLQIKVSLNMYCKLVGRERERES